MILAMMKNDDVYAGTPECNALLMNNARTIPVEHCVHYDVDVSDITYPTWDDYAKALNVDWDGTPAKLAVTVDELSACELPDTGRMQVGVCAWSRDKHRGYPHWKALVKRLKKHYDVHVFGRERCPIRQLVAEVSQLDKFVSVDTGVAHIAGCSGVPLVIVQGPTDCQALYNLYSDVTIVEYEKDVCGRKPCVGEPCKRPDCMYLVKPEEICNKLTISPKPQNGLRIKSEGRLPGEHQETIVIIRMKGIGDVLMTWFGLEVLRKENPDAHITYVTSKPCASLFYEQDALVDRVVIPDWDYPPEGIPRLPVEIRSIPADRLIDLTNRTDFHDTIEEALGDRQLLHTSPRADNFAALMGVNLDGNVTHRMLNIPDEMDAWACRVVAENDLADKQDVGKLVSCQLDAKGATRNWHIDRWVQLSKLLVKAGYSVVWFSVTPEHRYLKLDGVLNLACQTIVPQMVALVSKCGYAISTCSASIHIAHRLSRTIPVGIYGSTDYKLLATYYNDLIPITNYDMTCAPCADWGHKCLGQPGSPWCINQINPKKVFDAIQA